MDAARFKLLKELTELQGISGAEGRVRDFLKGHMAPHVDRLEISPYGNLFGIKESSVHDAPRLMVAAHMDEVGFMVSQITANGLFKAVPIGGWNPAVVSAQRFTLQTVQGDHVCISSALPPHLMGSQKDSGSQILDQVLFDAGFSSKEEAESYGVRVGDAIVPQVETVKTANGENIIAKAWDNRYGCLVLLETLQAVSQEFLPNTLIAGASTQEEVGLRGIQGAVHTYEPEVFFAVDCSPAMDTRGSQEDQGRLGDGFLLRIQDPGMLTHRGILEFVTDLASTHDIPYQPYFSKGGTDAGAAHTMNQGIPSGVIGVPGRYIHGHQTLFNISDYEAAKELLVHLVRSFDRTSYQTIIDAI